MFYKGGIELARVWRDEEVDFLKENINLMTYKQLADELKRSANCVIGKCYRERIKKDKYKYVRNNKRFNAKKWERWEDDFLRKNNDTMTDKEMGEHLGRTRSAVIARKRLLRAKKNRKAISCPNCNNKRLVGQTDAYHYYCRNCLTEFDAHGKILEPIWNDESI